VIYEVYDVNPVEILGSKRFMKLTEAAAALGVSYSFMRKLVSEGKVQHIRIGKLILIPEDEVKRIIIESIKR
jgi:excisionase family DNA binding protein